MKRNLLVVLLFAACSPLEPLTNFDDHTVPTLNSQGDFEALAVGEHGRLATKFIINGMGTDLAAMLYTDSHFYTMHDEWFWFRLINGQRIPGLGFEPLTGHSFATIADIYTWAKGELVLPFDLLWVEGERLYSPRFYALGLDERPRFFGLGTLIHVDANLSRPERWAFQLEFTDAPNHAEIVQFFEHLDRTLPSTVSGQVYWVVRSPNQELLAQEMESQKLPYFDRILRMKDLTTPGELEVYNGGLTAGRLQFIRSGESFEGTHSSDILVLEDVPDFLPPAAGVVTSVPQTPLAHFNLLAKNRGIPNAYQGGVLEDQTLVDLARTHSPVVMKASLFGELIIKPITEAQFAQWRALGEKAPIAVDQVDVATLPYSMDLRSLKLADADALRPSIGGKATGYLALLEGTTDATPDSIEAITIRPYVEHLAAFKQRIETMLNTEAFITDVRVRYLVLEGETRFRETHTTPDDEAFLVQFLNARSTGDVLGDLVRAGGLKAALRAAPLAPTTVTILTDALTARFGHYAVTQGLRFRSSSTAEDVEGFNGAGLYDSNTGFLDAPAQPSSGDRKQTIEWALKKTWASYWSFEAFEERRFEKVDHLSGNMGVVVHARFDDARENANGVFLLTLTSGAVTLDLNVQAGALSVTNPTSTELPEVDRVTLSAGSNTPAIERLRSSTVVPAGTLLMTDQELLETFARAHEVAKRWLAQENASRPLAQQSRTVVLDFEFRQVAAGWPALKVGTLPARIVLKQTRSLEPGLRNISTQTAALPIPKDILRRARKIERRTCESGAVKATLVEVLTHPLATPDLGYGVDAFTASLKLEFKEAALPLGIEQGEVVDVDHLALTSMSHPASASGWAFEGTLGTGKVTGVKLSATRSEISGAAVWQGGTLQCGVSVLYSTPVEYLLSLIE